jgi:hypothetical protein
MARRIRCRIENVIKIPLIESEYAIERVHRDASIGIPDTFFKSAVSIDELTSIPMAFVVDYFATAIANGNWRVMGKLPFANDEEQWPPRY